MPENVVIGREPAARHADEMESVDFQIFHQGVQIFRDGAGLRTTVRIRSTAAPSAPIENDNPITRLDEARNVVLPTVGIARVRVEQHERHAATATVRVPQAHAREIRVSRESRDRGLCRGCHKQEQRSRACVQVQERRSGEANNHQVRLIHQTSPKGSTSRRPR